MSKALKHLFAAAAREDATSAELTPLLPQADAELAAARQARAEAEQAYKNSLLAGDEAETHRLDTARGDTKRIDRAEALMATLRERLDAAHGREAEAARVERYEATRQQADEARRLLGEFYAPLAEDLVKILRAVAEAEIAVMDANADRPRGAEPIPSVEHAVRDVPDEPDEVVSERKVQRWVRVGHILPDNLDQDSVRDLGNGRGVIRRPGLLSVDCPQAELRTFIEQVVHPGQPGSSAYPLAERIALPGFRADDPDFWKPLSSPSRPAEVVQRATPAEPVEAAPRPAQTRHVPTPGAERVREIPRAG